MIDNDKTESGSGNEAEEAESRVSEANSAFRARLKSLIDAAGGIDVVAAKSGVPRGSLYSYVSTSREPKASTLVKLAATLGCSIDWLLSVSDEPNPSSVGTPVSGGETASPPSSAPLPGGVKDPLWEGIVMVERLAFSASAGNGALVLDELGASFPVRRELLQRLGLRPEHARMVEAVGTSMVPTIQDRDVLLVDASPDARQMIREGEIYLFTIDHEAYIKRLRRDLGQWIMIADNQELFPPRPIPRGEHVEIVGRVCWGAREL